jgi:uncharacterized membrane protein HdeD (DUF308 family)
MRKVSLIQVLFDTLALFFLIGLALIIMSVFGIFSIQYFMPNIYTWAQWIIGIFGIVALGDYIRLNFG